MVVQVQNAKSLTEANFTGTVTVFNSTGGAISIAATDIVRPIDWNSALNVFMTLSGNTLNTNQISGTNIVLAGGSNITLSAVTAAGAATVSIMGATASQYAQLDAAGNNVSFNGGNGSLYFMPVMPMVNVVASVMQMPVSFSFTSSSSGSRDWSQTWSFCLYSIATGGNSSLLTSLSSVSGSWACSRTSNSATYTFAVNGNSTSTTSVSFLTGAYILTLPMTTTFVGGETYYLGYANSTNSANVNSGMTAAFLGQTNIGSNFGLIGSGGVNQTNTTVFFNYGPMVYTSTSGAWPGSIASNSVAHVASGSQIYVEFINSG